MVFSDEERNQLKADAFNLMVREGAKGAFAATGALVALHFGAGKFSPYFRSINFRAKAFWYTSAIVAAFIIRAEKAHLERMTLVNADAADRVNELDREALRKRGVIQ